MKRRDFLKLSSVATVGTVAGCATNPVTGSRQLMLMSEQQEIAVDRNAAPHQFSSDFGVTQDAGLNRYVNDLIKGMGTHTHRPAMPYSGQVLNSPFLNAYTFPGGTVAVLRGLLVDLDNEAQLATILGHELGHVNQRHAAEQYTQQLLSGLAMAGLMAYMSKEHEKYADLAAGLGGISAGALLAQYSRQDEREADALALEYAHRAGHNPAGLIGAMEALVQANQRQPNMIERMFATHPMTQERYDTAKRQVSMLYSADAQRPLNRERFMDETASVRRVEPAIRAMQAGANAMMKKQHDQALASFKQALTQAPNDYAALMLTSQCLLAMGRAPEAAQFAAQAKTVYPAEPQSRHLMGMAALHSGHYDAAVESFTAYRRMLPGNPQNTFYTGLALENAGHQQAAAREYRLYLSQVAQGAEAGHARRRMTAWGYATP